MTIQKKKQTLLLKILLKNIKKKKFKKILLFDIDETLCKTKAKNYSNSRPKNNIIKLVNSLYDKNYYIKIFTGRYMGRCNEDHNLVKKKYYAKTEKQLKN